MSYDTNQIAYNIDVTDNKRFKAFLFALANSDSNLNRGMPFTATLITNDGQRTNLVNPSDEDFTSIMSNLFELRTGASSRQEVAERIAELLAEDVVWYQDKAGEFHALDNPISRIIVRFDTPNLPTFTDRLRESTRDMRVNLNDRDLSFTNINKLTRYNRDTRYSEAYTTRDVDYEPTTSQAAANLEWDDALGQEDTDIDYYYRSLYRLAQYDSDDESTSDKDDSNAIGYGRSIKAMNTIERNYKAVRNRNINRFTPFK